MPRKSSPLDPVLKFFMGAPIEVAEAGLSMAQSIVKHRRGPVERSAASTPARRRRGPNKPKESAPPPTTLKDAEVAEG